MRLLSFLPAIVFQMVNLQPLRQPLQPYERSCSMTAKPQRGQGPSPAAVFSAASLQALAPSLEVLAESLLGACDLSNWRKLHTSLNMCGTDTLRWSSNNPNSQNISKKEGFNLRYAFGPAPGREWWSLDGQAGIGPRMVKLRVLGGLCRLTSDERGALRSVSLLIEIRPTVILLILSMTRFRRAEL